jgi:CRP-like cAMP-binding protein
MVRGGTGNRILEGLNPDELSVFDRQLQEIHIPRGTMLTDVGQPARHLYFPVTAVLSLVGATEGGATVEVALVGREGVASISAALGRVRLPFRVVAQLEGTAWKIQTDVVTRQLHQCRHLSERLMAYSNNVIAQVAQSAVCNRFHTAKQRLARWLLMTADRVDGLELPLTHEFIAHMVGGPRSAVTEAASALRQSGAIDYRRGRLTIVDVAKLRQQSCECYDVVRDGHPYT